MHSFAVCSGGYNMYAFCFRYKLRSDCHVCCFVSHIIIHWSLYAVFVLNWSFSALVIGDSNTLFNTLYTYVMVKVTEMGGEKQLSTPPTPPPPPPPPHPPHTHWHTYTPPPTTPPSPQKTKQQQPQTKTNQQQQNNIQSNKQNYDTCTPSHTEKLTRTMKTK